MDSMRFLHLAFLLLLSFGLLEAKAPGSDKISDYIFDHLDTIGTLEKDKYGFVYVKIDDDFIYKLYELIQDQGFKPPPYFGGVEMHGAHISVIYSGESDHYRIGDIEEVGSKIKFSCKECEIVHPKNWHGVTDAYTITVDAPSLQKLRKKYGLPKAAHNFHITIGIKRESGKAA